jgi:cytoskeletal protein RodZ
MRLLFKALVVVVLAVGIGNYLIYLKTGQLPINSVRENYNGDWLAAVKESFSSSQLAARKTVDALTKNESSQPAPARVYKWTDANGQVHYGDKPQGTGSEQVEVKIQNAISPPDQQDAGLEAEKPAQTQQQSPLEKARAAAEAMKTRVQEQESQ